MRKFNYSIIALAMLVWACGGSPTQPQEPQAGEGVVQLPLTSTGPDGQSYRLVGATFAITGTQSATITDTSTDVVNVPLVAGNYTIQLEGEWHIERVDAPGQALPASLISPNPMAFSLEEGQTRSVRFLFKLPGNGNADVGFTVDTGGWFTGTLAFGPMPPDPQNSLASLAGTSVPFAISWSTATVVRANEGGEKVLYVEAGFPTVQFGGPYSELLHDRIAPALQKSPLGFHVRATHGGSISFSGFELMPIEGEPFRLHLEPVMSVPGVLDAEGFPATRPFNFESIFNLTTFGPLVGYSNGIATVNASVQ